MFRGHFYEREEKGTGFLKFGKLYCSYIIERYSGYWIKFVLYTLWIPVAYAIYLFFYEKDDLKNTAREFTAFRNPK